MLLTREDLYKEYEQDMAERAKISRSPETFGSWLADRYLIQIMNHLYLDAKKGF